MAENNRGNEKISEGKSKRRLNGLKVTLCVFLSVIIFALGGVTAVSFIGWDKLPLIWAINKVENEYYQKIDVETLIKSAMMGICEENLDRYSTYYTADEYSTILREDAGDKEGYGISIAQLDDKLFLTNVNVNSPCFNAGVRAGMFIYSVDGKLVTTIDELNDALDGSSTHTFVFGTDGEKYEKVITKSEYNETYIIYASDKGAKAFIGESKVELSDVEISMPRFPSDTAYIRLTHFTGDCVGHFAMALMQMKREEKTNLILDLRANGGGSVNKMSGIASFFIKDGGEKTGNFVTMVANYRNGDKWIVKEDMSNYNAYFSENSKITVIADVNTASASEALIGVMISYKAIDYSDIYIIGNDGFAKTYGKGIMQTTYRYPFGGEAVKLTTAQIYWPNGETIHGIGITTNMGANLVEREVYMEYPDTVLAEVVDRIS